MRAARLSIAIGIAVAAITAGVWTASRSDDASAGAADPVEAGVEVDVTVASSIVTFEGAVTEVRVRELRGPDRVGPLRSATYRGPMHSHLVRQALPVRSPTRFRVSSTTRECGASCAQALGPPRGRCSADVEVSPGVVRRIEIERRTLSACIIRVVGR